MKAKIHGGAIPTIKIFDCGAIAPIAPTELARMITASPRYAMQKQTLSVRTRFNSRLHYANVRRTRVVLVTVSFLIFCYSVCLSTLSTFYNSEK